MKADDARSLRPFVRAAFAVALSSAFAFSCRGVLGIDEDKPLLASNADAGDAGDEAAAAPSPFSIVQGGPDGETLTAIWGADANDIYVVGTNGVHLDYFAGSWHRTQTVTGRDFYGVWGRSATEVYAVGVQRSDGRGIIQSINGHEWKDEYLADARINGIWGSGPLIYAVGANGMVYGKQAGGTAWAPRLSQGLPANPKVSDASAATLWGISGNGANDFAMPAGVDRVFHYEGSGNFVNLDPVVDRTIDFRSVWGPLSTSTNVFFGSNYLGISWLSAPRPAPGLDATIKDDMMLVLHQDQSQPNSKDMYINGIWGTTARVVFVGDLGNIFYFDTGNDGFASVPSPTTAQLDGVWGSSLADVWIVGAREVVLHGSLAE